MSPTDGSGPDEPRPDQSSGQPSGPDEEVGSVGEEAAKLFGALAGWARDQGGEPTGLAGLAGHAAAAAGRIGEHAAEAVVGLDAGIDTGAPECAYCPICRTVHVLRQATPEVRTQLVSGVSSLLQAAAGFVAALESAPAPPRSPNRPSTPPPPSSRPGGPAGFERIDLDATGEADPDSGPVQDDRGADRDE